jgi:hypothetical protein
VVTVDRERALEHVRAVPEPHYPVPWRVAETKPNSVVVVCDEGHYTCEAPTLEAAQIIVLAVNEWAGVQ